MHATVLFVPSQDTSHLKDVLATNLDHGIRQSGMTNRAVAEKIGSTEHQVWRWRRGRHVPSIETLAALAKVLFDGDISQFYAEDRKAA